MRLGAPVTKSVTSAKAQLEEGERVWRRLEAARVEVEVAREQRVVSLTALPDLLDHMLTGVDPVSGEKLDEQTIVENILTFMTAGHLIN